MKDFVTATCAVTGQYSDKCVVTRWVEANRQGREIRSDLPEESGGIYGWGSYKIRYSDVTEFDVYVSKQAIETRLKQTKAAIGAVLGVTAVASIVGAIGAVTGNPLLGGMDFFVLLFVVLFLAAATIGLRAAMRKGGYQYRYATMEEFEPLGDNAYRRIAFNLSRQFAQKRALMDHRDMVWSAERFQEGIEDNDWIIAD